MYFYTDGVGKTWAGGFVVYRPIDSIRNLGSVRFSSLTSENCRLRWLVTLSPKSPIGDITPPPPTRVGGNNSLPKLTLLNAHRA